MKHHRFLVSVLSIALVNSIFAEGNCSSREKALIIALLAIHSGKECDVIVQKGLQQMAALESTLNKINADNNVKIELKIMDTCSSVDETVKSALRGMMFVEEECPGNYFFLGFLGPDDPESLKAVSKISDFFKYSHVVPRAIPDYGQFSVFNVEVERPEEKAKGIRLLLKELNWMSFILIHTSDSTMRLTAAELMKFKDFCVISSVLMIPSAISGTENNSAYNKLLHVLPKVHDARVVVLSDTSESVEKFFRYVDGSVHGVKFIIYIQGSGIFPWKSTWDIAKNSLILQETTKLSVITNYQNFINKTAAWSSYLDQNKKLLCRENKEICQSFYLAVDSSILPLIYSLYILSNALDTTYRKKCQKRGRKDGFTICNDLMKLNSTEWREILGNSKEFVKDEAGMIHRISFYMDLDSFVDMFVYNGLDSFDKVGTIANGLDLHLRYSNNLFSITSTKDYQCSFEEYEIATEPPSKTPEIAITSSHEVPSKTKNDYTLFGLSFLNDDYGYYKLLGTIAGFVTGVMIFIFLVMYFVYKSVRFKSRSNDSDVSRFSS